MATGTCFAFSIKFADFMLFNSDESLNWDQGNVCSLCCVAVFL